MLINLWPRWLNWKSRASRRARGPKRRTCPLGLEPLEDRTVPSTISWVNRGGASDTDNFASVFGANAGAARAVVDAAITSWQRVITSFNYTFGSDTYDVTVSMAAAGTGHGAGTTITGASGPFGSTFVRGLPTSATITIDRGDAPAGSPAGTSGSGGGWFLDSTPLDWSEFAVIDNAFAGHAAPGSAAFGLFDLYTVVTHELGHALGISSDNRLRLGSSDFTTNTGVTDNAPAPYGGAGVGTYFAFVGSSGFHHLLTSVNGGVDAGRAVHSAGPGDPAFPINFQGRDYEGARDLMNQSYLAGERALVPITMANILRDAYGYTVISPMKFGTFYAQLNQTTGNLLIRGGQTGVSDDTISVRYRRAPTTGDTIEVSEDIGNGIPGTGPTGIPGIGPNSIGTLLSFFDVNDVRSITVEAGNGDDSITLENTLLDVPVTIDAGTGNDTINIRATAMGASLVTVNGGPGNDRVIIGNSLNQLSKILGAVTVNGQAGSNELQINDQGNSDNNVAYTLTSDSFTRAGIATIRYSQFPRGITINGGSGRNRFDIQNTSVDPTTINSGTGANVVNLQRTTGSLTINGQGNLDQVNVGNAGSAQDIRGAVTVTNNSGRTDLLIDDSADLAAQNNVILGATSLTGLAPAVINWVQRDIRFLTINGGRGGNTFTVTNTLSSTAQPPPRTTLNTGVGSDRVFVRATTGDLVINGQDGRDTVTMSDAGSVQGVRGDVLVTNATNYTALTIDDLADPASHSATLAATSLAGLAPAVIRWRETSLNSLAITGSTVNAGAAGNRWTVLNTPLLTVLPRTTVLNAGAGTVGDTVNVRAANGSLTINGQAGDDRVKFFNFADSATIDGGPGTDTIEAAQGTLSTSQVPFTNVEAVEVTGGSTLAVNTDIVTGTIRVINGTLDLKGGIPAATDRVDVQAQGVLTGTGQINGNVLNAGQVRPAGDGAVGRITVRDDYAQTITGRLNLDLQGLAPGTQSDNLEVGHVVQVGGTLNLAALAGFNGDTFTLVSNRGATAVNGTFAGLPEGAAVMVGGRQFVITYKGNDGNDVVLHLAQRVNHAPVANGDGYSLVANAPLTVPAAGVLANDSDPDGDPITAVFVSGPAHGSLALNTDGSFIYTPVVGYTGGDSFTYKANDGQADSNVATVSLAVSPVATTTAVVSNIPASVFGQAVTFTATVTRSTPGAGAPTGMVEFKSRSPDGSIVVTLGTAPLDTTGRAVFTKNNLVPAAHTVFAVYVGDGTFAGSASADITQYVSKADTAISLSATASTVVAGQPVNFLATLSVVPPGAGIVPGTGTITFYDTFGGNTSVVAVITLGGPPVQTPAFTAVGTHLITAVYSGDDNYNGSTSSPFALTVIPGS
jgi:hypothetical protein